MCSTLRLMVLISMMGCVELITVKTPQKFVNVSMGESALLQCTFTTSQQTSGLIIQWNFVATSSVNPQQIYYYQAGKDVIPESYQGRIQPPSAPNVTKNASITISNMQQSDAGIYTCEIHNFPDVDGQSVANIIVHVLEKPSVPFCAVHGDVESGHLVTLTCHSERGSPAPTYTWNKLDQTKTRRPVLGRVTTTGIMAIRNLSQFEFGEYECTATNLVGFSTCTVELNSELEDGMIAGAVIGALLGCVLIILVVWFIAHSVKRQKYRAVKNPEAREMKRSTQQAPVTSDEVPMATASSNLHAEGDEPQA